MKITFKTSAPRVSKHVGLATVRVSRQPHDEVVVDHEGIKTIILGVEDPKNITRRKIILIIRKIVCLAKTNRIKRVILNLDDLKFSKSNTDIQDIATLVGTNAEMANYEFNIFKTRPKEGWKSLEELVVVGEKSSVCKQALHRGQVMGKEVNDCRTLANMPGGAMTPSILAKSAKKAAFGTKVKVKVLGKKELRTLGAGAILGVAQGSKEEPKLIVMTYRGGKKDERPIVFVGKGVTFDTGGINLKPTEGVLGMHLDMSGGAAAIHAITACSKLGVKINVISIIPAVENSPSGESYRPGDILKGMSGKTIQILNTDAEGRVILSDALTYAKRFNPRLVVDIATLTGAALVALGLRASAILTRDEKLQKLTQELGEVSGDYVWPLPLWEEYESEVESTFGDVTNIHNKLQRYGGTINGGIFLLQFAKDLKCPWMHIDMASRMETVDGEYLEKGAAGAPVRLLVALAERY
jgi:leucyl aminopeptidase